jgi:hypothetical protein
VGKDWQVSATTFSMAQITSALHSDGIHHIIRRQGCCSFF